VFGKGPFDYLSERPEEAAVFDEAMSGFTARIAQTVAEAYDFSGVERVIDVGGGDGALATGLLRSVPFSTAAVFDLPRVREAAEKHIASSKVSDRCAFISGDFFEAVPAEFDLYLAKHVIHDWNDERATDILRSIRRAIGDSSAKLLLVEGIYPAKVDGETRGAAANDCNMMVATGGRQRSESEFRALFERAGFRLARVIPAGMVWLIEGAPMSVTDRSVDPAT
jgi:hypothetical protein